MAELNHVGNLRELRLASIHINVPPIETPAMLIPNESIRVLELAALNFSTDKDFKFKADKFCKTLSTILPNVERMTIRCNRTDVVSQITERLYKYFTKLKQHKVFDDYEEHRDYLGKYKNVNEQFLLKRISFE